jgi:hypothetical protein
MNKKSWGLMQYVSILFPLPIFYDLLFGRFIVEESMYGLDTGIPLPLGFIFIGVFFLYVFFLSVIGNKNFSLFLTLNQRYAYIVISLVLFLYAYVIGGMTFSRVVQLVMPVAFFVVMGGANNEKFNSRFFLSGIFSFYVFIALHFVSIYINNDSVLGIDQVQFSDFYGMIIYQSLLSYPAVLSLYLTITIYLFISTRWKLTYILLICLNLYLMLSSGRKIITLELLWLIFTMLSVVMIINPRVTLYKHISCCLTILLLFIYIFNLYSETASYARLFVTVESDGVSSGRFEIYQRALLTFEGDWFGFFFGLGLDKVNFHNYFLDMIARIGLLLTSIYMLSLSYILVLVHKKIKKFGSPFRVSVFFIIIGQVVIQLLLNSPLNQPFYLTNLCFILLFLMYYPQKINRVTNKV